VSESPPAGNVGGVEIGSTRRDLKRPVMTVDDLRTRNVGLKVLAGAGAQIDTTTANGQYSLGFCCTGGIRAG
jgi:hypothetical protein